MTTRINDYDYPLPPELIARYPASPRDASRLLVVDRGQGAWRQAAFLDLPEVLDDGDFLVVNDTWVFPARLVGVKDTGGKVEFLLHHLPLAANGDTSARVRASYRARRQLKPGQQVVCGAELRVEILDLPEPGTAEVRLLSPTGDVLTAIETCGLIPLPPYLRRSAEVGDREDYQTRFAANPGAVACPTAGLHFTDDVMARLARRGIETAQITLHVGPGTFMPVRHEDYTQHTLLPEQFELSPATASRLNAARAAGKRLVAVGTTTVRVLEHCAGPEGFKPQSGTCNLYIYPGYRFRAVDRLLTNFHLPRSTLLLLVAAFAGRDLTLAAYQAAIANHYRFYSYGDCMLIV